MHLLKLLPRFRAAYRQLDVLAERECWSRVEIEAWQLERLNDVWRHARQFVPYYRELAVDRRLPREFRSLDEYRRRMPTLPKSLVRNSPAKFLSERHRPGRWFRTTGSTGVPIRVFHSMAAHRAMLQAKYRLYASWGVDPLDRMTVVWGTVHGNGGRLSRTSHRIKQRSLDLLRNRLRLSAYTTDQRILQDYLRRITAFRPAGIYGFSQALWIAARVAEAEGFACDSLKAVFMTAEPALPRMQRQVSKGFGAATAVEYGATECEIMAGSAADGSLRVRDDLALLETPERDDGRADILVTVLLNRDFPLLRYEMGDVADAPLVRPERGFAKLSAIDGRRDDLLWTATGRCLHPARIDAFFENDFKEFPIRRYRLHQHRDGSIDLQLEVDEEQMPHPAVERLIQRIRSTVDGFPVRTYLTDWLDVPDSVKLRTITSDYQPHHAGAPQECAAPY